MTLSYETNEERFDFPPFHGIPQKYIISSSPRCGSNMLQRALWLTKKAGAPDDYFTLGFQKDFSKRWDICTNNNTINYSLYIKRLLENRTSSNGVFGVKMHGSHLESISKKGIVLNEILPNCKFIWLKRRNKIYQSISYYIAEQTNIWILDNEWLSPKEPKIIKPKYNEQEIYNCLEDILRNEKIWESFYNRNDITPLVIYYEDILMDFFGTLKLIFNYLSIEIKQNQIKAPNIKKQANSLNDKFAENFYKSLAISK